MLGFADVQADRRVGVLRRNPFKQLVKLLERIGLQAVEIGIQFYKSGLGLEGALAFRTKSVGTRSIDRCGIIKWQTFCYQTK